ncbi:hypothetical protein AYO20_02306 [Fonsecaea nubica]|uniref:Uncharacterized protein n=1 Tax=Fonsecaea nubica TaxID=856822 RepID=A0A178D9B3_9EURO|nr:hypothetical protein AYO20_02306 [Fonsecaea nubica]OAL38247.1 hypothetical protein AYO20_02306 [Fonsecaea nubica]
MDEPLRKRPRLLSFPRRSSDPDLDEDLDTRRRKNDLLLKSRFESIFEKYSHDFSSIGDEIDMDTMSIVVNNGHVQSMENETDTGDACTTKGKSLLRAMTEVQDGADDYFNEGADEVITSIEEIAENTAMADDDHDIGAVDSDEELFVPVHARSPYIAPPDLRESQNTVASRLVDSEDELQLRVAQPPERSTSPDSLFQVQLQDSPNSQTSASLLEFETIQQEVNDNDILAKFGPRFGPEVLEIIRRARDVAAQAHIEPAWRLPTDLVPSDQATSPSKSKTSPVPLHTPPDRRTASPDAAQSLWKPPRRWSTKKGIRQTSSRRHARAESADPLQDGFSDHERRGDSTDGGEEMTRMSDEQGEEDAQILQMRKGVCFYCSGQWSCRAGVFRHWAKLAKDYDRGEIDDDDVHDLEYIHGYVSYRVKSPRLPRLVLSDFKTMVELHEGAGLTFDEIAECRALRTRKTGLALNDVYDRYRTPSNLLNNDDSREWSEQEVRTLEDLCQNPKRDIGTLMSHFKQRHQTEIGNKLAEMWLKSLWGSVPKRPIRSTQRTNASPESSDQCHEEHRERKEVHLDPVSIKMDPDSDDELFRSR